MMQLIQPNRNISRICTAEEVLPFVSDMHALLEKTNIGVALHHSQVQKDTPLNFFIIRKALSSMKDEKYSCICNARIVEKDKSTRVKMLEGCLSWRFRPQMQVNRYDRIKVSYDVLQDDLNIPGKVLLKHEETWISGLLAQIFQHEIDHGNGVQIYDQK